MSFKAMQHCQQKKYLWDTKTPGMETFYQYLKNKGDFNDLMIQAYYKEQGMSFVMLITGQIHQKMISASRLMITQSRSMMCCL